jgi:hypothetical protein
MIYSLLKRSRRAELNGGEITDPRAIIGEILNKTLKFGKNSFYDTAPFDILLNISL